MNTKLILALALASLAVSCETTNVVAVTDYHTKKAVQGASVVSRNGSTYSSANYTDANGIATIPSLPVPIKTLEVKKAGYKTTTVTPR